LTDRQLKETAEYESSDAYTDLQRDVLRYAEEVTRHIDASPDLFTRLKASLSDREIVELAMAVGIANFTNRVTETLKFELP
jgi:alkylhydroperoxidase family enzyme